MNNNNVNNNVNDITFFKESFYINDLLKSKSFTELNKNNIIKVKGAKFENKFCNDIKKINFYGIVNGEKEYYTLNYFSSFIKLIPLHVDIYHFFYHKDKMYNLL